MNQSRFLTITCNLLEAREKSRVHRAIGFGFASHWLKNCCDSFKPITKRSNRNHVNTFDSHLKTALITYLIYQMVSTTTSTTTSTSSPGSLALGLYNQRGNYKHSQQDDQNRFELHFWCFSRFWFPAMKFYRDGFFHVPSTCTGCWWLSAYVFVSENVISPSADLDIRLRRLHLFQSYRKVPTEREDGVWSRIRSPSSSRQIRTQTSEGIFKLFSSKYNGNFLLRLSYTVDLLHNLSSNPVFRLPILLGFYVSSVIPSLWPWANARNVSFLNLSRW